MASLYYIMHHRNSMLQLHRTLWQLICCNHRSYLRHHSFIPQYQNFKINFEKRYLLKLEIRDYLETLSVPGYFHDLRIHFFVCNLEDEVRVSQWRAHEDHLGCDVDHFGIDQDPVWAFDKTCFYYWNHQIEKLSML